MIRAVSEREMWSKFEKKKCSYYCLGQLLSKSFSTMCNKMYSLTRAKRGFSINRLQNKKSVFMRVCQFFSQFKNLYFLFYLEIRTSLKLHRKLFCFIISTLKLVVCSIWIFERSDFFIFKNPCSKKKETAVDPNF